ncbi:hypothetical protein FQA39_LY06973 [Lamprigera yunnana]|nr:hypothetical protein FQA39_LY06973 [Lamprigera yunnana]
MVDKYDSNGDYSGYGGDFKRKGSSDKMNSNEDESDDQNPAAQKAGEYIRELLAEKLILDQSKYSHAARLIDQEVARVQNIGRVPLRELKYVDIYREKPMKVAVKVLVPVREHPKFNFVGKLLGPKGNSMKRLQEDTMCKMAVLGRGSMKDRQKEEELRQSLDPKYAHLCDDLHVEISALGPPAEAHARIAFALAEVRKYLIPDNNDNIRQEQMREMEIITSADPSHKEVSVSVKRPSGILRAPESRPSVPMRTATRMPVTTPRVMPAKTKILSILDRARIAMEESYSGSYEEPYEPNEPTYDPYASTVSHSRSSYSTHYDSHDYDTEYYRESTSVYEGSQIPPEIDYIK